MDSRKSSKPLVYDDNLRGDIIRATELSFMSYFNLQVLPLAEKLPIEFDPDTTISAYIKMYQSPSEPTDMHEAEMVILITKATVESALRCYFKEVPTAVTARDTVGEIANSIYGLINQHLNKRGHSFKMDLPQFTKDKADCLKRLTAPGQFIQVPFNSGTGVFHVVITPVS